MFGFGKKKVELTIINADDGSLIAKSTLEPDALPETFDPTTTIHLQDVEFDVIEAEPSDRASYTKRGKLTLKVRKAVAQFVAPEDILYSLPTICNEIGKLVLASTEGKKLFEMHEDDWRQTELISKSLSKQIESELEGVNEIYREKHVPPGFFQAIYVRKQIKSPLEDQRISLADLKERLNASTTYDGIAFFTSAGLQPGMVENGFAFQTGDGIVVYGATATDVVSVIGLKVPVMSAQDAPAETFATLLSEWNLVLVDWCMAMAVGTRTELERYFEAQSQAGA